MQITKLPELTEKNLHSIMAECMAATANEETAIPQFWQGMLEMDVSGRTAKAYVPKNCPQQVDFVVMNVPTGEDTVEFLQRSGWIQKADDNKLCLVAFEPENGSWKSPAEEMAYIEAGYRAVRAGQHLKSGFSDFLVGYGPVGSCLQKIAMSGALRVSAAAYLDASNLDVEEVKNFAKTHYTEFAPFGPKRSYSLVKGDLPVPTWIVSKKFTEQEQIMADYWKNAACAEDTSEDTVYGTVFTQSKDSIFTPEGHILKVAVKEAEMDYAAPSTTDAIANFLLGYYRYGQGVRSNMVSKRVDYKAMGVQIRTFTDRNGFMRQYLVYIPEKYRNTKEKLPVVINFHGAQQNMQNMFENGLWYHVADEKGIIIVCAECVLGKPRNKLPVPGVSAYTLHWELNNPGTPDRIFVNEMLDRILAEFPADEKRIYADGHSMGCMMTNYLASGPIAHRFAAFCGTSGAFVSMDDHDVGGGNSPVWDSYGEYDMFGDFEPGGKGQMMDTLAFHLTRTGLATEGNVEAVLASGADETYVDGRYHHYVWKNKNGVPLLHYNWVEKKAHTHTPEENVMFWDNWFTKWSLDENGNRLYEGKPVD